MRSIDDLQPQLAADRRFWCGYADAEPDADLAIYRSGVGVAFPAGHPLALVHCGSIPRQVGLASVSPMAEAAAAGAISPA